MDIFAKCETNCEAGAAVGKDVPSDRANTTKAARTEGSQAANELLLDIQI